jgi:hypothetical protein
MEGASVFAVEVREKEGDRCWQQGKWGGWEARLTSNASALPLPKIHQDLRPTTWNRTMYRQVQKKHEIRTPNTQMTLKAKTFDSMKQSPS